MHAVRESELSPGAAARLPPDAPPAPWSTRLRAVIWWHRATPEALHALAPALRAGPRLPVTLAAFVDYAATPVGPYREVLASPVVLLTPGPAATVPFIAVDSAASVVGGRENWALPKTLARFEWSDDAVLAQGEGWTVSARVRARGPALPFAVAAADRQPGPDGGSLVMGIRGRGRARLGRAAVRVTGPDLPRWLRDGVHPALVVEDARVRFGAPRAAY